MRSFWSAAAAALLIAPVRASEASSTWSSEKWTVIVDAGSTGSRLYTYHLNGDSVYSGGLRVQRGDKVRPGLSALAGDPKTAAEQLLSLFTSGAELVPEEHRKTTRTIVQGTGGLRDDVDEATRERVLDAIYDRISSDAAFPFSLARADVGVVSGDDESFYAFAAANFLEGTVDHELRPLDPVRPSLIGALDLGGSSTQITYLRSSWSPTPTMASSYGDCGHDAAVVSAMAPGGECRTTSPESDEANETRVVGRGAELFARSYSGFGAQAVRDRIGAHLGAGDADPCAHAGVVGVRGTGDFNACIHAVRQALLGQVRAAQCSAADNPETKRRACALDGAGPVADIPNATRFLAMCNFFYAADAIRVLASDSPAKRALDAAWPTPPLEALSEAAAEFCALPWTAVAAMSQAHAYTSDDLLSSRCFEAAYILVLLRDAYALDDDVQPRVTFALDARGGAEVEWTLGYYLAEIVPQIDY